MKENRLGVALVKRACKLCGNAYNAEIILNKLLSVDKAQKVEEMHGKVVGYMDEPCEKCKEYMEIGFLLIEVDEEKSIDHSNPYRTGRIFVITHEAAHRFFDSLKDSDKCAFVTSKAIEKLGIDKVEPTIKQE